MLVLRLLVFVLLLAPGLAFSAGRDQCGPLKSWDGKPIRLSRHAGDRVVQRKVKCDELKATLESCRPFFYKHDGKQKTGCYGEQKVFLAIVDGTVLTVIRTDQSYVDRLKRK